MTKLTAGRCWELLIRFYEKQKGVKVGNFSNVGREMFGVKPLIRTIDEIVFDSNFLDEIEEMLDKTVGLQMVTYNFERQEYLIWCFNTPSIYGEGETRNLARARCLCKVIDEVNAD